MNSFQKISAHLSYLPLVSRFSKRCWNKLKFLGWYRGYSNSSIKEKYGHNLIRDGVRFHSNSSSHSVNKEEVNKFSRVGSDWWSPLSTSGTGPLHHMNPVRVQFIREQIAHRRNIYTNTTPLDQLRGLTVLDVGCGGGILAESLARLGANVTAIDPSMENIATAKRHAALNVHTKNIDYQNCSVENIVEAGKTFDVVCCLEVVEHVDSVSSFLESCIQCVSKDNGSLFISTINRNWKSYAVAILGAEELMRVVPSGTHDWNKFITLEEIDSYLRKGGFHIAASAGIVLKDLTPSLLVKALAGDSNFRWCLSNTDKDVNYIVHAVSR